MHDRKKTVLLSAKQSMKAGRENIRCIEIPIDPAKLFLQKQTEATISIQRNLN